MEDVSNQLNNQSNEEQSQEVNEQIIHNEVPEDKYIAAIVKPKQPKQSLKKWLFGMGVLGFCGGIGIGIALAVVSPLTVKQDNNLANEMNFKSKNISGITYTDNIDMDGTVVNIAKSIGPCVVSVYNNKKVTSSELAYYDADSGGEVLSGLGSGIIFKEDESYYYIMTNSHVVEGADSLAVNFLGDVKAACELVGKDSQNDIAVVKVSKDLVDDEFEQQIGIAPLGDSDLLEAGQLALAIGTPSADALNNTVTRGIISATQRTITISGITMTVIQTDAAINPGNSGGALVGPTGEVIGMNVAKTVNTEGIGFAIPINVVKPIVEDLMTNGSVIRPGLGIKGLAISDANAILYDLPIGIYIDSVITGGSADLAGIKMGDVLIQFDGKMITSMEQLKSLIGTKRVGDTVEVKVIRDGKQKNFKVQLREMPQ